MAAGEALVIGSGPGGAAVAWSLATAGVSVRILEAGPRYQPATDYRLHRQDWEVSRFPEKIPVRGRQTHDVLQALDPADDDLRSWNNAGGKLNQGDRRMFVAYHHVVGVGGTTLHYTGESHRLHPDAFRINSLHGVAADWPIGYADLEPWYQKAEEVLGVAGPVQDPLHPRSANYPLPPHRFSHASQVLGRACKQLGLNWTPNAIASLSQPYDGRPPCNYCGQCHRGCPRLDKGTADITFIAKALATGHCTLQTGCEVLRIEAGDDDRVKSVVYADTQGRHHRVGADVIVLACGAVETPRILLNSGKGQGLGNESGQVGKNFMETLFWVSSGLHPDRLDSFKGLPSDAVCWDFNAPDAIPGIPGGVRLASNTLDADLAGPLSYAQRVVGGWGQDHVRKMKQWFGHAIAVGGVGEHLPNPDSFIDLDPQARDRHGLPRARIHSRMTGLDVRRTRFIASKCREILNAAGVDQLVEEYGSHDMFNTTHVFGTCRMGDHPETSVVDRDCRSHRWHNLLITDASVFPSSGGGEAPSLTIYANALRAADRLLQSFGR